MMIVVVVLAAIATIMLAQLSGAYAQDKKHAEGKFFLVLSLGSMATTIWLTITYVGGC